MKPLPSIVGRLAWSLLASAVVWSIVVSGAVWLAVRHEVGELLDDTLQGAAEALRAEFTHVTLPAAHGPGSPSSGADTGSGAGRSTSDRYAWQVVQHDPDGQELILALSPQAPRQAFLATPTAGFTQTDRWRVYGTALGHDGRMLYVAQSRAEQVESALEVGFSAALATLAVALLSHLWLRSRAVQELAPLQRLSSRLQTHDLLAPGATLGPAERVELQPVHEALDILAAQLGRRLAHERAFNAHAAHALRTPLAGIDAQLAVALREAPPSLQPRLQRVRSAAGRLQRVVAALLALFRSGVQLHREALDLPALFQRLPVDGLQVTLDATAPVRADTDLLCAAVLNLLDNAVRHGAHRLHVTTPGPDRLRLSDDGPGVDEPRRAALEQALQAELGPKTHTGRSPPRTAAAMPAPAGNRRLEADGALAGEPTSGEALTESGWPASGDETDSGRAAGRDSQPSADPGLGLGLKLAALVARAHGGTLALPSTDQGFVVEISLAPGA